MKLEKEYIEVNRKAYNDFARQHAERHNESGKYDLSDEEWIKIMREHLFKKEIGNSVLEIGPGTGRMLKILEEDLNCRTCAVELSEEMIRYAKMKSPNTLFIEDNIFNVQLEKY